MDTWFCCADVSALHICSPGMGSQLAEPIMASMFAARAAKVEMSRL